MLDDNNRSNITSSQQLRSEIMTNIPATDPLPILSGYACFTCIRNAVLSCPAEKTNMKDSTA